jgi:transcriptional regulator with XRE-family HTH domain
VQHGSFKKELGHVVGRLRSHKKISVAELADRCGLTVSYLDDFEQGRAAMSADHVRRVADVLNIPASFLYVLAEGDAPERHPEWAELYRKFKEAIEVKVNG